MEHTSAFDAEIFCRPLIVPVAYRASTVSQLTHIGERHQRMQNLHLFTTKDEALLSWWNTFFLFNPLFNALNLVRWLDVQLDLCVDRDVASSVSIARERDLRRRQSLTFPRQRLDFDQHSGVRARGGREVGCVGDVTCGVHLLTSRNREDRHGLTRLSNLFDIRYSLIR